MKYALLALTLIALPACTEPVPGGEGENPASTTELPRAYQRIEFEGPVATDEERARCAEVGGTIVPSGKLQWENCVQPFADAGQPCTDSADCTGDCRYESEAEAEPGAEVTGTCQVTDARFGCYTVVEGGKIAHTICVD